MTELEKQLTEQNQLLEEKIHVLTEQVEFLTKKLFGRSTEKTHVGQGQLSIFDNNVPFTHQRQLRIKPSKKK
jgi:hypothetical protein